MSVTNVDVYISNSAILSSQLSTSTKQVYYLHLLCGLGYVNDLYSAEVEYKSEDTAGRVISGGDLRLTGSILAADPLIRVVTRDSHELVVPRRIIHYSSSISHANGHWT